MSKRKANPAKKGRKPEGTRVGGSRVPIGIGLLIVLAGVILAYGPPIPGLYKIRSMFKAGRSPATAPLVTGAGSVKEKIYAGGRLVATVDGNSTLTAPGALTATTASATQVGLTWNASTGGTVNHYQVERSQSVNGPYAALAGSPTTTTFTDTTASGGICYLYRVAAVDGGGNLSAYSNVDMATTVVFTDEPLVAGTTTIRARHMDELRQAVNAVRATAGLAAASWTDPTVLGVVIKAVHVEELRNNLDPALAALGRPVTAYTNPAPLRSMIVHAIDIEELRARVK